MVRIDKTAQKLQERLSKESVACVITMRHITHMPKGEEEKGPSLSAAQKVASESEPNVDYDWEMTFGPQSILSFPSLAV